MGLDSPDWGTVAAYLQAGLIRSLKCSACVVNFAVDASVPTQPNPNSLSTDFYLAQLSYEVVEVYIANYSMVGALADRFHFEYLFVLQPHIAVGSKPLTPDGVRLRALIPPALLSLADSAYRSIAASAEEHERLTNLSEVLDRVESQFWIDEWGDVTPKGNLLAARGILAALEERGILLAEEGETTRPPA